MGVAVGPAFLLLIDFLMQGTGNPVTVPVLSLNVAKLTAVSEFIIAVFIKVMAY